MNIEVISLFTESSQEESQPHTLTPERKRLETVALASERVLTVQTSYASISTTVQHSNSPRKSCAQRSFEYLLELLPVLGSSCHLLPGEQSLIGKINGLCCDYPGISRILGTLLARQWPKWHAIGLDDDDTIAVSALVATGVVETFESIKGWVDQGVVHPLLLNDATLCQDLDIFKSNSMLDILLQSIPVQFLRKLVHLKPNQVMSRPTLADKVKLAYSGKQRTIFGAINDTNLLLQKINEMEGKENGSNHQFLFLTEKARSLFLTLSFALDLDSDDEFSWNCALPQTVLKAMANKGITPLTPRRLVNRISLMSPCPDELRVYQSRSHIAISRLVSFMNAKIESKKICPKIVSNNIRSFLGDNFSWDSTIPEWWWRRQLPRRCSNLLWKCIAELERLKYYEVAQNHLTFLLDNNESLLGEKRRGKVCIRLLIVSGHLGTDIETFKERMMTLDLFPADVAELDRRFSKTSLNKYEWPCGPIQERTIEVYGAGTRDFNWVEKSALEHYYLTEQGGFEHGIHCEGRVMMDVFNSFFSEVLVDCSAGLMQSPLQRWSLDVGYLGNNPLRWSQVESILSEIETANYEELVSLFRSKNLSVSEYPLEGILACMRGKTLAGILRLIASDPFYWGGGQPDLLAWNSKSKRVMFSEVKGPGDHLSPRQRWWLAHLVRMGAEAEVCYVIDERREKALPTTPKLKKSKPSVIELD